MAISPEDPDVFERAVTVLVQHAQLFPAEWNEFRTNQLPQLLFENLNRHAIHRFGAELPSSEKEILLQPELAKMDEMVNALKPQIEHAWTDHGIEWLEGWKSENGALGMQTIRLAAWLWSTQHHRTPSLSMVFRSPIVWMLSHHLSCQSISQH